MALRRPPTRIELKTDDIDEYEEVMDVLWMRNTMIHCQRMYT